MDKEKRVKTILIAVIIVLSVLFLYIIINLLFRATHLTGNADENRITKAYESALSQINLGKMSVSLNVSTEEDAITIAEMLYDNPELFWLSRNYSVSLIGTKYSVQFTVYYENHDRMLVEVDNVVDEILEGIPENSNDYDLVKYVHDELCNRITYVDNNDELDHNMYGALVKGECVCEGYAKAFMYVLGKAGIESEYFSGTSMKDGIAVAHSWNGAYLDGELYYFDVTWDDIESEYVSYSHFALNSTDIMRNHSFDKYHPMIESSATRYNYYAYNNYILNEYSKENVAEIVRMQSNVVDIKCSSIVVYNKLVMAVTNPYQLNEILTNAESEYTGFSSYSYMVDDSACTVRLCFIN